LKLTFLGTGTSFGVPVVGCDCDACTSDDARDHRTRHGAVVEIDGRRLLVLQGVDVLVLNALWFGNPHATHFNVEEAIEAAREVGAARTYLTHLTHRVTHAELEARLPDGILPAYDGLTVELD
jgi:phosphoribosyl 1,2-cyclic phosphodiesterase